MKQLHRPIVRLALLVAALFAVYAVAAPGFENAIVITAEDAEAITRLQEQVVGRPLTPEERATAVDAAIEDELLVREAYRRGIDRGDPRVRGLLAEAVRRAVVDPTRDSSLAPTREELVAYHEAHRDRYDSPETITFDEAFFPLGALEAAEEREILDALRAGAEPASVVADIGVAWSNTIRQASRSAVSRALGREFAARLFDLSLESWEGPLTSSQGAHFVRLVAREPARIRAYDDVARYVEQDWYFERDQSLVQDQLTGVRRRYEVRIEGRAASR